MNEAHAFQNLPPKLATRHADLLAAMASEFDPVVWPDGEKFVKAHAPKAVAKILLGAFHPMVAGRPIAYLWRESITKRTKTVLATASLASGKLRHFAGVDFIIEFNFDAWQELTARQRVALVDHELMHCAIDAERMASIIVPHDIEEFGLIVERWGLWMPDLEAFGESVSKALQMSLFEPAGV